MTNRIVVLSGYEGPSFGRYKRTKRKGRKSRHLHGLKFGRAAKTCARKGHKPGTKSFGACMRAALKK